MTKTKVLIHGATGETGSDIVNGLLEDGNFDITALVRPQSAHKPAVEALTPRGVSTIIADLSTISTSDLTPLIRGFDIIISAVAVEGHLDQLNLVDAATAAGIKRFVPCGFTTVAPPSEVMALGDQKDLVHRRIWYHHLPYTIIDVGFWHQISVPRLLSGRVDYAVMIPNTTMYGDGEAMNLVSDKRDIGRWVARIVKDERTLNKRVVAWSDELSQKEIVRIVEEKSGEKIELSYVSESEAVVQMEGTKAAFEADPTDIANRMAAMGTKLAVSKYVRKNNTLENAKYLGYLDARELYPDLKPIRFAEYVDELLAGKGRWLYEEKYAHLRPAQT